ncbi:MAG: hypothetical protein PHF74_02270 [Dehalococcoidales bacterium]|nr:hypothetical protein [Dehalococcoidales bacterium]
MFGSNEENYFRARAEDFIKSRETANKGYLEAKMLQRKSSTEAMRQRYNTMQRFSTDNNALYIARKCRQCVASIDNTILAAQYRKMEFIDNERSGNKTSAAFRPRTLDIASLRKRYNLNN